MGVALWIYPLGDLLPLFWTGFFDKFFGEGFLVSFSVFLNVLPIISLFGCYSPGAPSYFAACPSMVIYRPGRPLVSVAGADTTYGDSANTLVRVFR